MNLPPDVTPRRLRGHHEHHATMHVSHGGMDTPSLGQSGHLADHAGLQSWAAGAGVTVPDVTDPASHAAAHDVLHEWRNYVPSDPGSDPARPTFDGTGPRSSPTTEISGSDLKALFAATPPDGDGKRVLSGYVVTGQLTLSGSDGIDWVLRDSKIQAAQYGVQAYAGVTDYSGTTGQRMVFEYCDIEGRAVRGEGATSACIYGGDITLRHSRLHGGDDAHKLRYSGEMYGCYLGRLRFPVGGHVDTIQIQHTASEWLIHWNTLDARGFYDAGAGQQGNRVLQTGSFVNADVRLDNIVFTDNWIGGGKTHLALYSSGDRRAYADWSYVFRRNKFYDVGQDGNGYLYNTGDWSYFGDDNVIEDPADPNDGQPVNSVVSRTQAGPHPEV